MKRIAAIIGNRLNEWVMTACLFGLSVELFALPQALNSSVFHYLAAGSNPALFALACLLLSYFRVAALIINGRSLYYGPHIRAIGGLLGSLVWGLMASALVRLLLTETHYITTPVSIPIYVCLSLGEFFTAYRAMTDVRPPS